VISNAQGEQPLPGWSKPLISTVIAYANVHMFVPGNKITILQGISKFIGTRLDWLFPNDKFADALEIIGNEIEYDVLPSFVAWRSDLLVPLKSQLAMDDGSITHLPMIYKGFHRKIRPFIGGDANYIKVSDPMPPVGHNLEARDSVIINNVLSV
ncbi:MAG: hypothetical protein OSJ74_11445, partial [Clostridia bacterium]|nr:hypothetical protein [Clostridia bacterium]